MSLPLIAFFNNKGGVGKTSLVYHLTWMYGSGMDRSVLAADLDPQSNLTAMFLDEDRLEDLWSEEEHPKTIYGAIQPLLRGVGDVSEKPYVETIDDSISLLVGDLALANFEDELSQQWPKCLDRDAGQERALRVISAFWRLVQLAAQRCNAMLALVDLGPNLGAINRAALIAADYIVTPLTADLFSLQGLSNAGPKLREWRMGWRERLTKWGGTSISLPPGEMKPVGYVIMQHGERLDRPVKAYGKWVGRIPETFRQYVMHGEKAINEFESDKNCLGLVKHYRSLMPLAQEARKPMFYLKSADGAIGAHQQNVQSAYDNFKDLAIAISKACNV